MKRLRTEVHIKNKAALQIVAAMLVLSGCGMTAPDNEQHSVAVEASSEKTTETENVTEENAQEISFSQIKENNPDAIARLLIPGTDVDAAIFEKDECEFDGTAFIEYPNATDFCDFNEIIYGIDQEVLLSYKDPDFFEKHKDIELYIEDDHITYEVVMARPWERVDLLTQYAFPSQDQCQSFLRDLDDTKSLSDNISDNFYKVTYMDFIITLVALEDDDPDRQFMVIARMVSDENGSISHHYDEIPGLEGLDK